MPDVTIGRYIIEVSSKDIKRISHNQKLRPTSGEWGVNDANYGDIEFREGGTLRVTQAEYEAILVAFGVFPAETAEMRGEG
jgi:hypothetical protein